MNPIRKQIVVDEKNRPVAVQVDYADWLEIERALDLPTVEEKSVDLARFAGTIHLTEEPTAYQTRMREEWE